MEKLRFRSMRFATEASFSLLRNNSAIDIHRSLYDEIVRNKQNELLINRKEDVLPGFLEIAGRRNIVIPQRRLPSPYWAQDVEYNVFEVFGSSIQFIDYHRSVLPKTTLPPEQDVRTYIDLIMNMPVKATLSKQFEILLDITNNDLFGAANLGLVASRLMARALDTRAYPNIPVGRDEMLRWNEKITQFEKTVDSDRNDGPGDTYYFWTHMFTTMFYRKYNGIGTRLYRFSFKHGTELMKFVREQIAHVPISGDHRDASLMGKEVGLAFAKLIDGQSPFANHANT